MVSTEENFANLLRNHHLKVTNARLEVLAVIAGYGAAVSQPVLEKLIGTGIDRVTLYRILNTFEEKGILHKVIDLNGTANYAMCSTACTEHQHHDEHIHFNCTNCHKVYCMHSYILPNVDAPEGFNIQSLNLSVNGICKNCNNE